MGEFQETRKKIIRVLSLIAFICPSILETQQIGSRVIFFIGGALQLIFTEHAFWALLMYEDNGPISSSGPIYVFMPYLTPSLITIFVWLVNCLSPVIVHLVFSQKISVRRGIFMLVLISIIPFLPGIPEYAISETITYIRLPLILPQIASFITLVMCYWKGKKLIQFPVDESSIEKINV